MVRFSTVPGVVFATILSVVGAACAAAPQSTGAGEQLRVPALVGWTAISNLNDPVGENSEWVPKGQNENDWTRKISIQAFRDSPLTAIEFLTLAPDRSGDVCDGTSASPIQSLGTEGHDVGERVVYCYLYKGDGMGHTTLYCVIRGKQALYVTSMAWRTPPFTADNLPISEEQLREAQTLNRQITLCSGSTLNKSCM